MSHQVESRDVQHGTEMAWHGLTIIPEDGVLEIDKVYPWQVFYAPLSYGWQKPDDPFCVGNTARIVRHGKWVLPIASDDGAPLGNGTPINLDTYTPECPRENWRFAESVLAGTEYVIVSAGAVNNRGRFFVSIKLREMESLTLIDGSKMELIWNSLGSLDKTLNKKLCLSGLRTVCNNTLMMNFLGKQEVSFKLRHSKNMAARQEAKRPVIEEAVGFGKIVQATFDKLIQTPMNKDDAAAIYAGFISRPLGKADEWPEEISTRAANMVAEHVNSFESGPGNSGETEFDLLNGWTEPRSRGYSESDKDKFDTWATSEFGSYAASKSEFARMLVDSKLRESLLPEVLSHGRDLMKTV